MFPAGREGKDHDRIEVRKTRYKIKRYMVQPKDVEVKHNGGVVRRWLSEGELLTLLEGEDVIIKKSYDHSVKM